MRPIATALCCALSGLTISAAPPDVAAVRTLNPALLGTGIPVAQVEAPGPGWQANPTALGHAQGPFRWVSAQGIATNFPNSLGEESWHANEVGQSFFGLSGIAPGVSQVDNFEANYFTSDVIPNEKPIQARIVNQSFAFFVRSADIDQDYDNYAARYNVLFVSGAGNSGRPKSPGTAYNSICVGAYGGVSSVGPITDGRSKPDLVAPGSHTSFSAPLVSGAAALLAQAAGANVDVRLLKALLLNGTTKPADWTNSTLAPLHPRHGAGILNVYHSYRHLLGGRITNASSIEARRGWALCSVTATGKAYDFVLSGHEGQSFSLTATLIWQRQHGQTNINNLDLSLYRDGELVAASRSAVDNVEHLYSRGLLPGNYRLEVTFAGDISLSEDFALAYDFRPEQGPRLAMSAQPFAVTILGEPLQPYRLECSADFKAWTPVYEGIACSRGTAQFHPETGHTHRFFRAIELP